MPDATPPPAPEPFAAYFVQDIGRLLADPAFQEHYPHVRLKLQNFLMHLQRQTCKRFEHDKMEAANRMLVYEEILNALTLIEAPPKREKSSAPKRPRLIQTDAT